VKVNFVQETKPGAGRVSANGGEEPAHIAADRADMERVTDTAVFHGKPVRLWQGASQVQAPVIEVSRTQQRLIAHGEEATGWSGAVGAAQVHTVLARSAVAAGAGAGSGAAAAAPKCGVAKSAPAKAGAGEPGERADMVRLASGGLVYSGILREAEFTGGVRADTVDATIRANQATAFLQAGRTAVAAESGALGMPSLAGNLERVVASGHVDIARPGLRGTGSRLVYTANDRAFLLTGDRDAPPKAVNAQGTTTAAALRFDSCENSVEALGAVPGEPAQGVRTESRLTEDRKKAKDVQ